MAKSTSFAPSEHEDEHYFSDEEVAENGIVDSDNEEAQQSRGNSDDEEEVSYLEEEEEEEDEDAPECDESTLVINLSTPTMMKREMGNTLLLNNEEHFYIPNQESPTVERKPLRKTSSGSQRKYPTTPSAAKQVQMSTKKVTRSSLKNGNAVLFQNGSPTTIAPANMHYALADAALSTPSAAGFPSNFFDAASLGYSLPGMSADDLEPMDSTEMIRQFTNFSPEKTPGKKNHRKLRKSRSASNLAIAEVQFASPQKSPMRQPQFERPVTPTQRRPSPKLMPSTIKEESTTALSVRKVRNSPSDFDLSDRNAKRIRSKSRSPVKQTPRPLVIPTEYESYAAKNIDDGTEEKEEEEREASETVANLVRVNSKTPRESRRRRETLEFRQFSREFRDFSAINLNSLASLKEPTSEEKQEEVPATPAKPIETAPPSTSPPRRRVRPRRSMSGPPVPPHIEIPGTERKPSPAAADMDEMRNDMSELVARISALEAELAITKSQLHTSQHAHEATLLELRGEKNARRRAEGIIDFMKMESKFILEAHISAVRKETEEECKRIYQQPPTSATLGPRATRFHREATIEHDDDDARSVVSTRSTRSIRSVNSNDNTIRPSAAPTSRRPPPVATRAAAAPARAAPAPSRTRDPIVRPSTTLGMYAAPARTTRTTSTEGRKVLTSTTSASVLNQQPIGIAKGKFDMTKTRQQAAAASTRGPGGAMRPAMVGTGRPAGARR